MKRYIIKIINLMTGEVMNTNYRFFTKKAALEFAKNYKALAFCTAEVIRR